MVNHNGYLNSTAHRPAPPYPLILRTVNMYDTVPKNVTLTKTGSESLTIVGLTVNREWLTV